MKIPYTMEYSAIKMNTFESVLVRCITLEPAIQSEVNQKETYYCARARAHTHTHTHTHTHIWKSTRMVLTYLLAEQEH